MDDLIQSRDALTQQIAETEAKLAALRAQVHEMDRKIAAGAAVHAAPAQTESVVPPPWASSRWPMAQDEYRRYGRQMIVEEIGLQGLFFSSHSHLHCIRILVSVPFFFAPLSPPPLPLPAPIVRPPLMMGA